MFNKFKILLTVCLTITCMLPTFVYASETNEASATENQMGYTFKQEEPEFLKDSKLRKNITYWERTICWAGFNDLSEVEDSADFIFKLEILPEAQTVSYVTLYGQPLGHTRTQAKVLEVFKDDAEKGDVKKGDIITLLEPYYYITEDNGEIWAKVAGNYRASLVGDEYIFFLVEVEPYSAGLPTAYVSIASEYGRYLVKSEELSIVKEPEHQAACGKAQPLQRIIRKKGDEQDVIFTREAVENLTPEDLGLRNPDMIFYNEIYFDVIEKYN